MYKINVATFIQYVYSLSTARPDSLMEEQLTPNEQIQVRFLFGAP